MLAAAAIWVQAAQVSLFAPPTGVPLLVTTEHHSDIAGTERRYQLRRLIRFTRTGDGYRAEVRVLHPSTDADASVSGMVDAGFAALAGRTLVFHLDSAGTVNRIDDMAALWERLCEGIATMVAARKPLEPQARKALAQSIATPLRSLGDDRRLAMLSTLVSAIVASEAPEPGGALTPVRLPGVSPLGQKLTLEGMRATTALEGGEVQSVTRASNQGGASGSERIELERLQRFDPRTGLITLTSDTSRTRVGSGDGAREGVRTTIVRLVAAPVGDWVAP